MEGMILDSDRFDGLVRRFSQTGSRRQTLRGLAGVAAGVLALGVRGTAAGSRLGGAVCDKPTQCASGKCLTSGKCSCSASMGCTKPANRCKHTTCDVATKRCVTSNTSQGTACPDDGNPCTKNICDGSGHCTHPNKTNGITCSTCQTGPCACQDGTCQTNPEICIESLQPCTLGTGPACCEGRTCRAFPPGCWGPTYCCRASGETCTNGCDCCSATCAGPFVNGLGTCP